MTLTLPAQENRFVMAADWGTYEKILDAVGNRSIRVTFDGSMLEIMSPGFDHERGKTTLGALLEQAMVELGLDFQAGGSTTFKEEALQKGLEPDECYWILPASLFKGSWDPAQHSTPDLVLEVEISRSVLDRLAILAALGVREVWRLTAEGEIRCLRLGEDGAYHESAHSELLPQLPLDELARFVRRGQDETLGQVLQAFRSWLRER